VGVRVSFKAVKTDVGIFLSWLFLPVAVRVADEVNVAVAAGRAAPI
jgi:hypothetical protein